MKIASEIDLPGPQERIWNILLDFAAYPEWNRLLKSVRGEAAPEASIEVELQYYGRPAQHVRGRITGFMPPKYLSWSYNHKFGSWFMTTEHVMRLKEKEDGSVQFFQDVYQTGLGLRFGRGAAEHAIRFSLDKLNDDLKHRLTGSGEE